MAHNVNFNLDVHEMESGIESPLTPLDENVVHDSFTQLIQEQSHSQEGLDCIEMSEMMEGAKDNAAYLASPDHHDGRGQRQREDRTEEALQENDPMLSEHFSSATLRVLSAMPSRTIGRNRGAIISQYYNRTMQLRRRRQSRPSVRNLSRSSRPSIRGYGMETDGGDTDQEAEKRARLVVNLQNLSASDRIRMLRTMPLSLSEKRDLRLDCHHKGGHSFSRKKLSCLSQIKYYFIIGLRQGWYSWLSFLHSLQLWQMALKRVSGRFGTGVLSYFVFLKTLLLFNIFLFLVNLFFLVIPQLVHPPSDQKSTPFTGLELLTGVGYFSETVMFYGYYTNSTINSSQNSSVVNNTLDSKATAPSLAYSMPLAYFFTIGVSFFITCICLVFSMSKSFGESYRIDAAQGDLAMKAFCSWDFKVIKNTSVNLQHENISTQLKEVLSELACRKEKKSVLQKLARLAVHLLAWSMCLGSTLACALAIYYFSIYMHQDLERRSKTTSQSPLLKEASLLALPVVVSSINLLMPGFFNTVAWMEEYDSPNVRTYIAICRNLVLKVSVLGVLCFHWLGTTANNRVKLKLECWETFVGQELYRFLLMDFIFTILDTFFGEFLWKLFSQRVLKRKRKPVFDIARNVLELIYGQTLAWLGVLFSPLLPAMQIIKLFLLFYMKETSLMMNCQSPIKPWRASQMTTIFISLLCFPSFLGAAVAVTFTIWTIQPSELCGPFRTLNTMLEAGKKWVEKLQDTNLSWLSWIYSFLVENPLFLFVAGGVFLIVIYFHTQVVDGQRKIISLLQEQIQNEGEDKKFLITKLQAIHEQKRPISGRRSDMRGSQDSY
ncbi:transmembrane channel-like protein 6b [Amia ocellicauda]|uniref:transmembrane channel-like protein 6b n=1 Tax=Amia ocellicauda TaxID=2972642 RepID=UPI003463EC1C